MAFQKVILNNNLFKIIKTYIRNLLKIVDKNDKK